MIRVRVTQSADPTAAQLTAFKQYASVPDNSQDAMLAVLLKQAMLAVQEFADKAMLSCTLELVVADVSAGERIRLYQGGTTVTSALDKEGDSISYEQRPDGLYPNLSYDSVKVTYTNTVNEAEVSQLTPIVWQYATALYDGAESKDLMGILKTCYGLL